MVDVKNKEIQDLFERYQKLEEVLNEIKFNEDKLKEYEKRIALLGAEIVTTKNLYDVFLKTKSRYPPN